jgi:mannan endo-1,4-beta-mannosidase
MMRIDRILAAALVGSLAVMGCSAVGAHQIARRALPSTADCPTVKTPGQPYIGVAAAGFAGVRYFITAVQVDPNVISYYVPFGDPFAEQMACDAVRLHALPLIQIDPSKTSVGAIANGRYHAYLLRYAKAVRAFHDTVAISFGHEMNGTWYSWGYKHTAPSTFVRAWRIIHDAFSAVRARNVIWIWTIDRYSKTYSAPLRDDWPGAQYVNWVGVDAYYRTPSSIFNVVFAGTLRAVHQFTHDPVLITETGAAGIREPQQILDLFAGVRRAHLLGLTWFDINAREPWQMEGYTAAAAAFHRGVQMLRSGGRG